MDLCLVCNLKVNCSTAVEGGENIPQDVQGITSVKSDAAFVLVVEKDATFQKMLDEDALNRLHPFILGKLCNNDALT